MAVSPKKMETLVRWLNLVPYFSNHSNSSLMEAAENLGIEPRELRSIMQTLTCLGVGKYHGELFDMEVQYQGVHIIDDLGLNQPLRLTPTEASTYLLTLEALEDMPGLVDTQAVVSASEKLRSIMDKKAMAIYDSLAKPNPEHVKLRSLISQALEEGVQLEISYWSASRDATSTRVINPKHIFVKEDDVYLRAWQEDLGEWRTFKVDRITEIKLLDTPSSTPELADQFDSQNPFGFEQGAQAQLAIAEEYAWLAEHYELKLGNRLPDGRIHATMTFGSEEWFIRFALGNSDRVQVLGPDKLVHAVANAAQSALASYTR